MGELFTEFLTEKMPASTIQFLFLNPFYIKPLYDYCKIPAF